MANTSLNTQIPSLGFGTYGRHGPAGHAAIECALNVGYRHLDTAQNYFSETAVGAALTQSGLDRDEVFVTTKVTTENFGPGMLVPSLEGSLKSLKIDQVDLTLIHWPSPHDTVPLAVYLEQIISAQQQGLTRQIGVSNFTIELLTKAIEIVGPGNIACNQIELSPVFKNNKIANFCQEVGVAVVCYQPIAQGRVSKSEIISDIATKHAATPEQVSLAWEFAKGYVAIPTSSNSGRIADNFKSLGLTLSEGDMARIETVPDNPRHVDPAWMREWD